jgi:putative flippase GtrA
VRFVIVGGIATLIQYVVLMVLVAGLLIQPWVASDIGFVVSAVYNYLANRRFTFDSRQSHLVAATRFAIMVAIGVATNTIIMRTLPQFGFHYLAAQLVASAAVLVLNFSIAKYWVFATPSQ